MNRQNGRPIFVVLLSLFFTFGVLASGTAALLLLIPGTALDALWRVNPRGHQGFVAMGTWAVSLLLIVSALCGTAAMGLWRCRRWGYWTATSILCVNLLGDMINSFLLRDWRSVIGLPIAGLMLAYLIRNRKLFTSSEQILNTVEQNFPRCCERFFLGEIGLGVSNLRRPSDPVSCGS